MLRKNFFTPGIEFDRIAKILFVRNLKEKSKEVIQTETDWNRRKIILEEVAQ